MPNIKPMSANECALVDMFSAISGSTLKIGNELRNTLRPFAVAGNQPQTRGIEMSNKLSAWYERGPDNLSAWAAAWKKFKENAR